MPPFQKDVRRPAPVRFRALFPFKRNLGCGEDPAKKRLDAEVSPPHTVPIARDRMVPKDVIRPLALGAYRTVVAGGNNRESQMPTQKQAEMVGGDR